MRGALAVKHGWRDLAAARLDQLELRVATERDLVERAVLACGPLPAEPREALQLHAIAPLIGPLQDGETRPLVEDLRPVKVHASTVQARAHAAADDAEHAIREEHKGWPRRHVQVGGGKRKTATGRTVEIHAHERLAGKAPRPGRPESPEALSLTSQQSAKRCRKSHVYVACGCGSTLLERGCGSSDCVDCAEQVAARRARRVAERVEKGLRGEGPVHRVILTIPKLDGDRPHDEELHQRLSELRRRLTAAEEWRKLGRAAAALLRSAPLRLRFCVEATHPVGDASPEEFQPHFNFVGVQCQGSRFYLRPKDIAALRAAWAGLLGLPVDAVNPPEVSFYWPRRRDREKAEWKHSLRYTLRPFPGWAAWLPSIRWFGAFPKGMSFESFCPHCGVKLGIRAAGPKALELALREMRAEGIDPRDHGWPDDRPIVFPAIGPPEPGSFG